jgi:hypothetical protein
MTYTEFYDWWMSGESSPDNPFEEDSPAYWAWEGCCAAVKAERERVELMKEAVK